MSVFEGRLLRAFPLSASSEVRKTLSAAMEPLTDVSAMTAFHRDQSGQSVFEVTVALAILGAVLVPAVSGLVQIMHWEKPYRKTVALTRAESAMEEGLDKISARQRASDQVSSDQFPSSQLSPGPVSSGQGFLEEIRSGQGRFEQGQSGQRHSGSVPPTRIWREGSWIVRRVFEKEDALINIKVQVWRSGSTRPGRGDEKSGIKYSNTEKRHPNARREAVEEVPSGKPFVSLSTSRFVP